MNTWYSPNISNPYKPADLNRDLASFDDQHFDVRAFNKLFEDAQIARYNEQQEKELNELNKKTIIEPTVKKIHNLTIAELLLNIFDTIKDILDDLIYFRFDSPTDFLNIFIKNNRIFYIGIIILFISFIFYILTPFNDIENIKLKKIYISN